MSATASAGADDLRSYPLDTLPISKQNNSTYIKERKDYTGDYIGKFLAETWDDARYNRILLILERTLISETKKMHFLFYYNPLI